MINTALVTGANGHLGNTIVRKLLTKGFHVKAGVRDLQNTDPFKGLNVELVELDLLKPETISPALQDVSIVFHCAAVFKHWAPDPENEIIQANMKINQNLFSCPAIQQVEKIVFVSSITALDYGETPLHEGSWNSNQDNPYAVSKTRTEKFALQCAAEQKLDLVSILPAAIIGPFYNNRLTPSMEYLAGIISGQAMADPCFSFNYIHVDDVAEGAIMAAKKGKSGERYILGSEKQITTTEIFAIANKINPAVQIPAKMNKLSLQNFAAMQEAASRQSMTAPLLSQYEVDTYYEADLSIDMSKSRQDLGFFSRPVTDALIDTFYFLNSWRNV